MDNTLVFFSPAKINLFLHVLGQRDDGYHRLQSCFRLLDFGDQMRFTCISTSTDIELFCEPDFISKENNLIYRAAKLLQTHCQCRLGVHITVAKTIPTGAGLGGGSSNAATTLKALNMLWGLGLHETELMHLSVQLGADVPFFVKGKSAFVEGIGEQVTPIDLPEKWYLLLFPDCHADTAQVFSSKVLTRNTKPITIRAFQSATNTPDNIQLRNDCEQAACLLYPEIQEALSWLNQHCSARMTGTGACVFAEFDNEEEASTIAALAPSHISHMVAKGLDEVTI